MTWQQWTALAIVVLTSWAGVVLTVITLPGVWLAIAAALGVKLWQPEMISWWTIGVAVGLGLLAELVEFGASAAGAAKGGATRAGGIGAVIGSFVGALAGS